VYESDSYQGWVECEQIVIVDMTFQIDFINFKYAKLINNWSSSLKL
jgi:hypothetical protein